MSAGHRSGRNLFGGSGFGDLPGELWPDLRAIVRAEIQPGELSAAFLFDGHAIGDGDSLAPSVDARFGQAKAPSQTSLKAAPVKEGEPGIHTSSMVQPNLISSV